MEQAIDLRFDLRVALLPFAQYEQILTNLRAAETLAEGLADQRRLGSVCRRIASTLRQMQDIEQALAYCQRAHAIATALGDVGLQGGVNLDMGQIYSDLGDYCRAMEHLQQTLTAFQGERRYQPIGGVVLPSVNAHVSTARCLSELGEFADGVAYGNEALQIAEVANRPIERLHVYYGVGSLHLRQGTLHQAIPLLERAVALSQDADIPYYYRGSAAYLALAYALAGRAADALAVLEQVVGKTDRLILSLACGETYLRTGYVEEAHRLVARVLTETRDHKMRGREAQALWLLGEIAMRCDPPDVALAKAHYQQARALAEELGMRPLVAHCQRGLGTLDAKLGRQEPARTELFAAIELYRSMAMTFWLPAAEAALAQVEGR
jgi:tetratricopeptide (TPR) repeat protein